MSIRILLIRNELMKIKYDFFRLLENESSDILLKTVQRRMNIRRKENGRLKENFRE